jgi:site-specific DNA-methyltransferase (adenine-specific)
MQDTLSYIATGDCLKMMRNIPDKSIDHIITDPPYEANVHKNQVRSVGVNFIQSSKFELDFEPLTQENRVQYALQFVRIARKWILVFCQNEATGDWMRAIQYAGGIFKRTCIWIKSNPQPQLSGDRPAVGHECFVAAYGNPGRSIWSGGGKPGTYQALPEPGRIHATQKPVGLMDQLILDFTQPGETILDPFAGSGTTLVSAKRYGRMCSGMEQNPEMAILAQARIQKTECLIDPSNIFTYSRAKQLGLALVASEVQVADVDSSAPAPGGEAQGA